MNLFGFLGVRADVGDVDDFVFFVHLPPDAVFACETVLNRITQVALEPLGFAGDVLEGVYRKIGL
jgi:hypothetical protein